MAFDVNDLVANLQVEALDELQFRAESLPLPLPKIYGGQVLAQAMNAASRTVGGSRLAHSMHAYFLRPGDAREPIIYNVDPIRDGGSFTTRRVVATQKGEVIFSCIVSFQEMEAGIDHQLTMPAGVPAPETLARNVDRIDESDALMGSCYPAFELPLAAIDIRSVRSGDLFERPASEPVQGVWFRFVGPLPDDPALHRTLLTYISDRELMLTGLLPHGLNPTSRQLHLASLDHSLWFHDQLRVDDWLYYHLESPRAAGGRAFARGSFYTREGVLVASSAQEGLVRQLATEQRPAPCEIAAG